MPSGPGASTPAPSCSRSSTAARLPALAASASRESAPPAPSDTRARNTESHPNRARRFSICRTCSFWRPRLKSSSIVGGYIAGCQHMVPRPFEAALPSPGATTIGLAGTQCSPEALCARRQLAQRLPHGLDQRRLIWSSQELFDVPPILVAAGVQLQQNEVLRSCGRQLAPVKLGALGAGHDIGDPPPTTDDDVYVAFARGAESDDTGQRIRGVSRLDVAPRYGQAARPNGKG